ncbi:MAG: hypothetical protein R2879_00545 [Saprospiraceae bacterium]
MTTITEPSTFDNYKIRKIKNLFIKDVNRSIETVIKADDQDHVLTEVSEYVATKEIIKQINKDDLFGTI